MNNPLNTDRKRRIISYTVLMWSSHLCFRLLVVAVYLSEEVFYTVIQNMGTVCPRAIDQAQEFFSTKPLKFRRFIAPKSKHSRVTLGMIYISMIKYPKYSKHSAFCHKELGYRRATAGTFVLDLLYNQQEHVLIPNYMGGGYFLFERF